MTVKHVQDYDLRCLERAGKDEVVLYVAGTQTTFGSHRLGYDRALNLLKRLERRYGLKIVYDPNMTSCKSPLDMVNKMKDIDAVVLFGPARYDIEVTLAETLLKPIMYFIVNNVTLTEEVDFINKLPIYPYDSPFITYYFNSQMLYALSDFLDTEVIVYDDDESRS